MARARRPLAATQLTRERRCGEQHLFLAPLHGSEPARACLRRNFPDLSPACLERFVDNYGCVIAHCKRECIYKLNNNLAASPNEGDSERLSSCLLCDEHHCSPVFMETAGANRRSSNTLTEIKRPQREVCGHVNAL